MALCVVVAAVGLAACGVQSHEDDGGQCVPLEAIPCDDPSPVDLLFVLQNGGNVADFRTRLADRIEVLLDPVLRAGIDLQIGVLSASMDTPGGTRTCRADHDHDGVLSDQVPARFSDTCSTTHPRVERYVGDAAIPLAASETRCRLHMEDYGCVFPQSLEATLKALATERDGISFADGTSGHGDDANRGFLRSGSLLTIVYLMTQDDCSASVPAAFDPTSSPCADYCCDEHLQPISRYVEGLSTIVDRTGGRLLIVPIVGVPQDLLTIDEPPDFGSILGDHRMAEESLECGLGSIYQPGRRMVELTQRVDVCGGLHSVCELGLAPVVGAERTLASIGALVRTHACGSPAER